MTAMAFVYLARNAGRTFDDLAWDIRTLARPGDRVVLVDDGSGDDTPARIGRFGALEGWGTDVAVTTIITGTPGAPVRRDLGLALNLALAALTVPDHVPTRVVILAAGTRIDTATFGAARAQAEAEDLDALLFPLRQWSHDEARVIDPPGHAAWPPLPGEAPRDHALRQVPAITRVILRWSVLATSPALRASEDRDSHGDLALVWQVLARAQRIGLIATPAGHGPHPPAPGLSTVQAAADLIRTDPAAAPWVLHHLPDLLAGLRPKGATWIATEIAKDPPLPPALLTRLQQVIQSDLPMI
jgi:hypothetical protein